MKDGDGSEHHDHDAMDGAGEIGDGEHGGQKPLPMTEAQREQAKATIRDAANKAVKAAAGNVPEGIAGLIGRLNEGAKVSWKQQLRNIVASARSIKNKSTRLKANRRFELEHPGKKKERQLIVGVCTDSSGSVSDEAYSAFMNEIHHLSKQTSITYLIQADCEVQKIDVIKGGKAKAGVLGNRKGYGGTAYQPAIDACLKRKCDVIIYFGDMDSADTPDDPKVPFIWVRVGKSQPPGNFGRVVDLD